MKIPLVGILKIEMMDLSDINFAGDFDSLRELDVTMNGEISVSDPLWKSFERIFWCRGLKSLRLRLNGNNTNFGDLMKIIGKCKLLENLELNGWVKSCDLMNLSGLVNLRIIVLRNFYIADGQYVLYFPDMGLDMIWVENAYIEGIVVRGKVGKVVLRRCGYLKYVHYEVDSVVFELNDVPNAVFKKKKYGIGWMWRF